MMIQFQAFERVGHSADRIVELQDGLTAQSHRTLTTEALVGHAWHVDIVGAEIHEERFVGILLHEAHGARQDGVGDVFVAPERLAAAFHISDAADAVDDGLVVAV